MLIWRDGKEHQISFTHGVADEPLKVIGDANGKKGTQLTFLPSEETFTMVKFDYDTLEHRLRELAFLNSGVRIVLTDNRGVETKTTEFMYHGGIVEFVKYLDRAKTPVSSEPIFIFAETDEGLSVECALWWNDRSEERRVGKEC